MFKLLTITAVVAALVLPATANAGVAPVVDQYGNPLTPPATVETAPSQPQTLGDNLPLTGFELGFLVLAGAGLLGSGLMLRKVGFASSNRRPVRTSITQKEN